MKNYIKLINFFSLIFITIGFYFYFNEKVQFSNYRFTIFVLIPIVFGLILLFVNLNIKLIIFNTILIFLFFSLIFETYFLILENNKVNYTKKISHKDNSIPQLCGSFFKNTKNLDIYPLGGISNIPVKLQNIFTKKITQEYSDDFGFKNYINWSIDNQIDFMFIGDSFTYGADVAHGEAFVDYFALKHPNTINLGCGGTGPIIQKGIFSEYVIHVKPKYIIWNLNLGNDVNSDIPEELNSYYKNYLDPNFTQNLILKQSKIDEIYKKYWKKFIKKKIIEQKKIELKINENNKSNKNFLSIFKFEYVKNFLGLNYSFNKSSFETLIQILNQIKKDSATWNGKLIVNVIPSEQKFRSILQMLDYNSYNDKIVSYLKDNDFNYIDLNEYFNKSNYGKYFYGHFTLEGNKFVSNIILKKISDLK